MKIRLSVNGEAATAVLNSSAAAQLVPSRNLEDYAVVERTAPPPRKAPQAGTSAGTTPKKGDITYYTPWRNMEIFVRDDSANAPWPVQLGTIESILKLNG